MKDDANVIFTLRAISDYAKEAFRHAHNERYYIPPPHLEVTPAASRESSVATNIGHGGGEEDGDGPETWNTESKGNDRQDFGQQLRFTFDQRPRNIERGFVFGSNPKTCDVFIGVSKDGVSSSHFRITFDDQKRLVLIDSSALGTAVSYGGQARDEKRKNPQDRQLKRPRDKSNDFPWILFPGSDDKRVIIGESIQSFPDAPIIEFLVEVVDPDDKSCPQQYTDMRDAYLEEMRTAIPFGLNIDSHPTTAGQTESHSPRKRSKQRPIWIDREEIGSGEFGTVYRAVDVSTGVIYAAKTFLRNGKGHRERWDREVALLRNVSHHHIVKFVDHDAERKYPRLIMEYLPLGNLEEQNRISRITEWETVTLLCQGLDALDYLHSRKTVHRDLKPANILVQRREPANFCIKIADFGLAKHGSFLETVCGTQLYAAPEIWWNHPYTDKIDIWSLGVLVFQYAYGLPEFPTVNGRPETKHWYPELIGAIHDWDPDELLDFLSSSMLRMDPCERLSASECLRESAKLREAITPVQDLEMDPGTPTEPMSSSAIMRAFQAAGSWGSQAVAAQEAETQIDLPALSLLKSGWQPPTDRGDEERAAEDVGTQLDFPTLRTLKSGWRPEEYPATLTQIWDLAPGGDHGSEEGSQQRVESSVEKDSQIRHSKRQRIEQPGDRPLLNYGQTPWRQYQDQVLIEHLASGCIQMVLEGKAVSMRKSDWWLNATQLITLAGKTKKERDRIMATLKQHTKVEVSESRPQQSWISYSDGRLLCQFLVLTDTLLPLLDYGLKQGASLDDKPNFLEPEFLGIKAGETTVYIRRKDLWVNATHIVKAGGFHRRREIPKIRERETYDYVRAGGAAGTYVSPSIGLQLCEEYGLNELQSVLRQVLEEHGYQRGDPSQPAVTAPRPTMRKTGDVELLHSTIQKPEAGSSTDQRLSRAKTSSNLCVADTAKHSQVSCFTETENASFLPPIKGSLMQPIQPKLCPSSDQLYRHT